MNDSLKPLSWTLTPIERPRLQIYVGQVPSWAVAPGIAEEVALRRRAGPDDSFLGSIERQLGTATLATCMGPAIHRLRVAALLMLFSQIAFTALVAGVGAQSSDAIGHYPAWVWALVLPVAILRCSAEWNGITHAAAPYAQLGGSFTVCRVDVGFNVWLALRAAESLLNLLDTFTDSSFAANVVRTVRGPRGHALERLWTWQQSLPAAWGIPAPDLERLAVAFWVICLIQVLIPVVSSCRQRDFSSCAPNEASEAYAIGNTGADQGCCCRWEALNNESVAFALADASGMASLQRIHIDYIHACAVISHVSSETSMRLRPCSQEFVSPELALNAMISTYLAGKQMAARIVWSYVAENTLQLYLQTTMFALRKHMEPTEWHKEALLSIAIGLVAACCKLGEAKRFLATADFVLSRSENQIRHVENDPESRIDESGIYTVENCRKKMVKLRRLVWVVRAGCAVLVLAVCFVLAKLLGAFLCESALLNVTGCAVLHGRA